MSSWVFLLVGSVGAVGAALVVGSLGALLRLARTGTLPGQPEGTEPPAGAVLGLWVRILVGLVVVVVSVASLVQQDLLFAG